MLNENQVNGGDFCDGNSSEYLNTWSNVGLDFFLYFSVEIIFLRLFLFENFVFYNFLKKTKLRFTNFIVVFFSSPF
jgi:hypothetical protein